MDKTIYINGEKITSFAVHNDGMDDHGATYSLTIVPNPHADHMLVTMGMDTALHNAGLKERSRTRMEMERRKQDLRIESKDNGEVIIHGIPQARIRHVTAFLLGGLRFSHLLSEQEERTALQRAGFAFRDADPPEPWRG